MRPKLASSSLMLPLLALGALRTFFAALLLRALALAGFLRAALFRHLGEGPRGLCLRLLRLVALLRLLCARDLIDQRSLPPPALPETL